MCIGVYYVVYQIKHSTHQYTLHRLDHFGSNMTRLDFCQYIITFNFNQEHINIVITIKFTLLYTHLYSL